MATISFVVEDGTGLADATSYCSVEFADQYFVNRGNTTWAAITDTSLKQAALIRGTTYVDEYGNVNFSGTKMLATQALEWPRNYATDAYDNSLTGVPVAVKNGTCEAAIIEYSNPDSLSPTISGGSVIEETVSGAVTVKYSEGTTPLVPIYTAIVRALRSVMKNGAYGGQKTVLRT